MTTTNPQPDKVAIVEEITGKLNDSVAVFVSEYRGMTVGELADLRTPLRDAGAEHKVYKNTLARLAANNAGYESLAEHLLGPTALTRLLNGAPLIAQHPGPKLRRHARGDPTDDCLEQHVLPP